MNLWNLLPDFLLFSSVVLYLPLLILPCYLICLVIYVRLNKKHENARKKESLPFYAFLLLSLIASTVMLKSLGPQIGVVIPPLLLLSNLILPLVFLFLSLLKASDRSVALWGGASLAGGVHALSWSVWLMALAGS
ncbi:hypothetical protein [Marinomonas sp. PE14-40]|uniref:hypothetical protein n=1 Tax=Marinomonas sp. PE14-40 TaxID=3060621 RepID=UPI003F676A41